MKEILMKMFRMAIERAKLNQMRDLEATGQPDCYEVSFIREDGNNFDVAIRKDGNNKHYISMRYISLNLWDERVDNQIREVIDREEYNDLARLFKNDMKTKFGEYIPNI